MILGLEGLNYKENLGRLGFLSVECRKLYVEQLLYLKVTWDRDRYIDRKDWKQVGLLQSGGTILVRQLGQHGHGEPWVLFPCRGIL